MVLHNKIAYITYIVGQDGKQQGGILAVVLEHHQTLQKVCPK